MADQRDHGLEESALERVISEVSEPSFELLLEDGAARGMRPATARRDLRDTLKATVRAQVAGEEPTDTALHRHGGPAPDTTKRLFRVVDLEDLPAAHTRTAVEKELVPEPERLLAEARTEPVTGPDKFGVAHVQPPPGIGRVGRSGGAPNTRGGIASVYLLAECGGVVLSMGEIALQQEWWRPQGWPADRRQEVEQALRERADFWGREFVHDPHEVADHIVRRLAKIEALGRPITDFKGMTIVGGRMCMGFPVTACDRFGAGTAERFLGLDLVSLGRIAGAGFEAFLEVPQQARSARREPVCDWVFDVEGVKLGIADLERLVHDRTGPWEQVDGEILRVVAPGTVAHWVTASATSPSSGAQQRVTLVFLADFRGATDMFVTTLEVDERDAGSLTKIVGLAAAEVTRRRPGSRIETSIEALLRRGYPQRNQRRRHPERRGFSAMAHTAHGVIELVRHAA